MVVLDLLNPDNNTPSTQVEKEQESEKKNGDNHVRKQVRLQVISISGKVVEIDQA